MTTRTAALDTLRQAVRGFRFASPADEATWIALVLTVLARELALFTGPAPLFLISGAPGVGKTLLAKMSRDFRDLVAGCGDHYTPTLRPNAYAHGSPGDLAVHRLRRALRLCGVPTYPAWGWLRGEVRS